MKFIFFLVLYVGFVLHLKLKNLQEYFFSFLITTARYFFGFPIKEYSEYFDCGSLNKFFVGKEYNLSEYLIGHFIINLLIENIPIIVFVALNNYMLGEREVVIIDPIMINIFSIIFTSVNILLFFNKKFPISF